MSKVSQMRDSVPDWLTRECCLSLTGEAHSRPFVCSLWATKSKELSPSRHQKCSWKLVEVKSEASSTCFTKSRESERNTLA